VPGARVLRVRMRARPHGPPAVTGMCRGTDWAVELGLCGLRPESADLAAAVLLQFLGSHQRAWGT